jgi:hypothetical protein
MRGWFVRGMEVWFGVVVVVAPLVSTNKYFRPRSKLRPLN